MEEKREFAILTNEISKATFGVSITKHKEIKGLNPDYKNQNLRDHMGDLELIFSMLGEKSTTEIARAKNVQGFKQNKEASQKGGKIAGDAREKLELETGKRVISSDNFLALSKIKKIKKKK